MENTQEDMHSDYKNIFVRATDPKFTKRVKGIWKTRFYKYRHLLYNTRDE